MRRITTWALSTISALVLLFSYHTSTNSAASTSVVAAGANGTSSGGTGEDGSSSSSGSSGSTDSSSSGSSDSSGSSGSSDSSGSSSSSGSSDSGTGASGTFTGDAVQTRYGPVQVEITVENGSITKSVVTQVPWNDHRDQEINSYAVPILNEETVQAQSAGIDMVSGATFTSQGYIGSLQSAIDQANL